MCIENSVQKILVFYEKYDLLSFSTFSIRVCDYSILVETFADALAISAQMWPHWIKQHSISSNHSHLFKYISLNNLLIKSWSTKWKYQFSMGDASTKVFHIQTTRHCTIDDRLTPLGHLNSRCHWLILSIFTSNFFTVVCFTQIPINRN